jgi:hypothetical protein
MFAGEQKGRFVMKAIVVTDQATGIAGMKLVERPEPKASLNDVVVQVYASGFTPYELTWPSTWVDRIGRDRTPSIPGHEVAVWLPLSVMEQQDCLWDSGCLDSQTGPGMAL